MNTGVWNTVQALVAYTINSTNTAYVLWCGECWHDRPQHLCIWWYFTMRVLGNGPYV